VNSYAADGFFPLALAAHFGQPAAVQLLLDRGADVSQAAANPMKVQALHAAVAGRNHAAVKMLLEAGADPNVEQHGGWTARMAAEEQGDAATIDLLRQFGATPTSGYRPTTS
jgi:ankyrin repeat protein